MIDDDDEEDGGDHGYGALKWNRRTSKIMILDSMGELLPPLVLSNKFQSCFQKQTRQQMILHFH